MYAIYEEIRKGKRREGHNFSSTKSHCTVRVVLPEILPEVAVMVALPAETAVAKPLLSAIVTEVFDERQVTRVVISWLVPSE